MHKIKRWWLDVTIFFMVFRVVHKLEKVGKCMIFLHMCITFLRKSTALLLFVTAATFVILGQFIDEVHDDD